jgi:hypothetical protein
MILLGRSDTGAESPGFRIGPGNTLHGWDYAGRISAMAEHSGAALVAFDAEHSTIVLARGDAVQPIFHLTRVPDVSRTSLTLARRIDAAGLALAGVSRTSGDIFTGPLDCRAPANKGPIYRMLSDVSVSLSLSVPGEEKIVEPSLRGATLLLATPDRVCLEGLMLGTWYVPAHEIHGRHANAPGTDLVGEPLAVRGERGRARVATRRP